MKTGIVASNSYLLHRTGPQHPECPARAAVIVQALQKEKLLTSQNYLAPRSCTEDELLLCHTKEYVQLVQKEVELCKSTLDDGSKFITTGDAPICSDSFDVASLAVGGVLTAVDAVMNSSFQNAFAVIRPPGHHACSNKGMGFCLFNNVAIGARYLQKQYNVRKVLIVDWDVHHGNGTQEIFERDPSVFYFSTHQRGIYPGTGLEHDIGSGDAKGTKLNCPIDGGMNAKSQVFQAFDELLVPAMKKFQPEFVLISCGFDGHKEDPLGGFNLSDLDFFELTNIVKNIASTYCQNRLVSALEGGYNLSAIARSSVQHSRALSL
jgi:acetoin utilization deacetylase AcuC-like enzyme